jgi:hypothetical protein
MELLRGSKKQSVRLHELNETISTFLRALIPHFLSNVVSADYQPLSDPDVFLPELAEIWLLSTSMSFFDLFEGTLYQTWTRVRKSYEPNGVEYCRVQ